MKDKQKILYLAKFVVPLVLVIALFVGAFSYGIITFQRSEDASKVQEAVNNQSVKIIINFGGGSNISFVVNTTNITVYDLLLNASKIDNFTVESTYWQQFDSYVVDSITYNDVKYEADSNHYWGYYVNGNYGTVASDKQFVQNNDTIEWKFEEF